VKTKRRLAVVATAVSTALYLLAVACGTSHPPAADGSGWDGDGLLTGPCSTEGSTAACHVETGREGNIVNCFSGKQVCHDGVWGPCGAGESGTLSAMNASTVPSISALEGALGGLRPQTVSASGPSRDAGGCASNPCNPYCLGVEVDADTLAQDGAVTIVQTVQGSSIPYESFSGPKAQAQNVAANYCSMSVPATGFKECNYDYCCASPDGGGTNGTCVSWTKVPDAGLCNRCTAGRDFTTGIGCKDGSGVVRIPVCNRGEADANTGKLVVMEWSSNPSTVGTGEICSLPSSGSQSSACVVDLATKPIPANECIEIRPASPGAGVACSDPSAWSSGNRVSIVNPPSAVIPANLVAAYGGSTYAQAAECDSCNNQSFVNSQPGQCAAYGFQPPPPAEFSFRYSATCAAGSKVVWNQFSYASTVPDASKVVFRAQTANRTIDGGVGAFTSPVTLATIQNPGGPDPASCPMIGPSPCPKNLGTLLGAAKNDQILELLVNLVSTTAIPSVQGWQVTYNCIPNE